MLGVFALLFPAWGADVWPMAVGRLEKPVAVRLAEGAPPLADVVRSETPVAVALIRHESGEIAVRCGLDARFRCYAEGPEGPLQICAGPGDAPCLDGSRLEIPGRVQVLPHRVSSDEPQACRDGMNDALAEVRAGVKGVLEGGGDTVLRGERAALAAPRLVDACKGWYGRTGYDHNRGWCEVKAAEHVALLARVTGSTEGLQAVLDALIADCCVGDACPVTPFVAPG